VSTTTVQQVTSPVTGGVSTRDRRFGVFSVALALGTLAAFARGVSGQVATFDLNVGSQLIDLPALRLPVLTTVVVLALGMAAIGAVQATRGAGGRSVVAVGVVVAMFVLAFLTWAAGDGSLNLMALLRGTVRGAVPLTFGALAGVLCERAGVINIAIEAQLLTAAFVAAVAASVSSNPWVGLVAAMLAGAAIASILGVLTIRYRADQIIVGVVLVVFATGLTGFLTGQLLVPSPDLNAPRRFSPVDLPVLSDLPVLGPLVFGQSIVVYLMFATVALVHVLLFSTRWGLRVRSVGEHPKAADTVGIDVLRVRYQAVILGGVVAGIGGAYFTLDSAAQFSRDMSAGRGFIALAAMLVGRYSPVGAFGAALVFGFAEALATALSIAGVPIPSDFLLMAPYLATILVVAGVVGRVRVPAADGQPYVKE
jgi:general nucleoside transport system permease protein